MPFRLICPAFPFDLATTDEQYQSELELAQATGIKTARISFEDLLNGTLKTSPALPEQENVVYRGWMLSGEQYARFFHLIRARGSRLLTSPEEYLLTHHLPNWYAALKDFTPETCFFATAEEAIYGLQDTRWPAYFVKDWVKSLSTGPGPIAQTVEEIPCVVDQMKQYRGEIEGGLCIRRFEPLVQDSEERYFVVEGKPYSRTASIPEPVKVAAQRIASPFFSVDVIQHEDGRLRIMELGDGQVSDLKQWTVQEFQPVLAALSALG